MICPEPHVQEKLRLQALDDFDILDSPMEQEYDDIATKAAEYSKSPIALISLIDEKRQWFKSNYGLEIRETPREYSFCAHAINTNAEMMVVEDARIDPRFRNNPFVLGEPHVVFYAGVVLRDTDNLPLGTLCIIDTKPKKISTYDIRSLKVLAEQVILLLKQRKLNKVLLRSISRLNKKNKDLEKFAYVIAHDLKAPLINIAAISTHLSNYYARTLDDEGKTMISLIQNSSDRLKVLIEDILNYYKDENKIHEEVSSIHLKEFYNQLFEEFTIDTSLQFHLKTSLKLITLNRTILYQIMVNLISNAIRYNDKTKVIVTIGVLEKPLFYEFYVQDNGPGIPEQLHEKIFDLFMIGKHTDKKGKKGKGIGLATVKKLIENLGGTIKVTNGKEGGCTFRFQIKKSQKIGSL